MYRPVEAVVERNFDAHVTCLACCRDLRGELCYRWLAENLQTMCAFHSILEQICVSLLINFSDKIKFWKLSKLEVLVSRLIHRNIARKSITARLPRKLITILVLPVKIPTQFFVCVTVVNLFHRAIANNLARATVPGILR